MAVLAALALATCEPRKTIYKCRIGKYDWVYFARDSDDLTPWQRHLLRTRELTISECKRVD